MSITNLYLKLHTLHYQIFTYDVTYKCKHIIFVCFIEYISSWYMRISTIRNYWPKNIPILFIFLPLLYPRTHLASGVDLIYQKTAPLTLLLSCFQNWGWYWGKLVEFATTYNSKNCNFHLIEEKILILKMPRRNDQYHVLPTLQ